MAQSARSILLNTIAGAYYWSDDEIDDLAEQFLEQRLAAWRDAIESELRQRNCRFVPNDAKRNDRQKLRRDAMRDAKRVANTYNRQLDNQLKNLFVANPRGNRGYYKFHLRRWVQRRGKYKNLQINVNQEMQTRAFARERFMKENKLQRAGERYIYAGPSITSRSSDPCKRRTRAGLVTFGYTQREKPPTHPNCFHQWELARRARRLRYDCEKLWKGS